MAAALHSNVWHGHGPGQIRARPGGPTLIDPVHGWRQALLAADLVLGDFGAVAYHSAAGSGPLSPVDPRRST
ncbi:hypothetical protein [Streptomyces cinereoruber]|uniref:hypothetical protein n=1 Tax=Streptomyces cinereoruber TaxID=67260 RepID=UPI0036291750